MAARNVFHAATTTWLPGTVHSRISSLSRRLTRPRVASRYDTQLGLPAILNNALARAGAVLAVPLFGRLTISRRQAWAPGLANTVGGEWHPRGGAQFM